MYLARTDDECSVHSMSVSASLLFCVSPEGLLHNVSAAITVLSCTYYALGLNLIRHIMSLWQWIERLSESLEPD